jgi:protein-disulfide isomerase
MEKQELTIPVSKAIIYGALIIALVIGGSYAFERHYVDKNMPALVKKAIQDLTPNPENVSPVTTSDHVLGDPKAPVSLIVFTDLECPFCKTFHQSIEGLKDNYIKDGKIAVIYRNMPLDGLHTKARSEAIASECVAKLGGNSQYWAFVDKIFANTPSNDGLDQSKLPVFASEVGINQSAFASCLKDKAVADKVAAQEADGQKAGAQGTPYPIVLLGGEVKGALPGALPTDQLKKMVDDLTAKKS